MKIARMVTAAALVAASLGISGAASAQDYRGDRQSYQTQRGESQARGSYGGHEGRDYDRGDRGERGERGRSYGGYAGSGYSSGYGGYANAGYGYGYGYGDAGYGRDGRCVVEWRHHHRIRRCW